MPQEGRESVTHRKVREKQAKELTEWGRVLMTPVSSSTLLSDLIFFYALELSSWWDCLA